jgi:hypothetical protein
MSKFYESYNANSTEKLDALEAVQELAQKYPEIAEALYGHTPTQAEPKGVPAMTLMLSIRDGRVRWQLSSQESNQGFGGVVRDPASPLEAIEKAVLSGDFDRWAKKGK